MVDIPYNLLAHMSFYICLFLLLLFYLFFYVIIHIVVFDINAICIVFSFYFLVSF